MLTASIRGMDAAESPAAVVCAGNRWRVPVAELARWIGVDVATLHRWHDAEAFARARGVAPDLIRALAPRWEYLTRAEADLVRREFEHRDSLGATHALLVLTTLPIERPEPRPAIASRHLFGRARAQAFNYKRDGPVGAFGR